MTGNIWYSIQGATHAYLYCSTCPLYHSGFLYGRYTRLPLRWNILLLSEPVAARFLPVPPLFCLLRTQTLLCVLLHNSWGAKLSNQLKKTGVKLLCSCWLGHHAWPSSWKVPMWASTRVGPPGTCLPQCPAPNSGAVAANTQLEEQKCSVPSRKGFFKPRKAC